MSLPSEAVCGSLLQPLSYDGSCVYCGLSPNHDGDHESEFYGRVDNFEPEVLATLRWPNHG